MPSGNEVSITPTKSELSSVEKNVTCTEDGCFKTFIHTGALNLHLVKTHGILKNDRDKMLFHKGKLKLTSARVVYHCPVSMCKYTEVAGKSFPKYSLLKQHYMKMHAETKYSCTKCKMQYSVESWRDRHQAECGKIFQCGSCPVKYTTRHVLHTHCKRHDHKYPEEYSQQEVEKSYAKRKTSKSLRSSNTVAMVNVRPIVLFCLPTPPPKSTSQPKPIKCKPLTEQNAAAISDRETSMQPMAMKAVTCDSSMQTDIYGINSLTVKGHPLNPPSVGLHASNMGSDQGHQDQNDKVKASSSFEAVSVLSPPKKILSAKRKLSIESMYDRSSIFPQHRKKAKSTTTGMQTSVSLTQRKRAQIVSGTQTSGDYILRKAMAKADIPIETKTVASQVTPQKPRMKKNNMCSSETQTGADSIARLDRVGSNSSGKPALVDSYSQVKQRHIWAETSHNLAERQTMTDLPPSISTQTLQSYLVNQMERNRMAKGKKNRIGVTSLTQTDGTVNTGSVDKGHNAVIGSGTILIGKATNFHNSETVSRAAGKADSDVEKTGTNAAEVVHVYNEQLEAPLSVMIPNSSNSDKRALQANQTVAKQDSDIATEGVAPASFPANSSMHEKEIVTPIKSEHKGRHPPIKEQISSLNTVKQTMLIASTSGILFTPFYPVYVNTSVAGTNQDGTNVSESSVMAPNIEVAANPVGMTTDTEAQAMSATEFESLLQSSGIFLDNAAFLTDQEKTAKGNDNVNNTRTSVTTSDVMTEPLGPEFDFLSDTHTIDMDTQTAFDFSIFDNCSAIDTNTQTGGDIDFLDLVTTSMQTQTLNEDDLASLGLGGAYTDKQTDSGQLDVHSLGVGTSDLDFPDHGSSPTLSAVRVNERNASAASTSSVSTSVLCIPDTGLKADVKQLAADENQYEISNQSGHAADNQSTTGTNPLNDNDNLEADGFSTETQPKLAIDPVQSMTLTSHLEMQTQTVGCDAAEPLFQIETQTQVDSRDTEFVTMNMETQTTTEDLEQLASWFGE